VKINKVFGREIINSSGVPALSCEIVLEDGTFVSASVPSDTLSEQEGLFILKDGGARCAGQGLQRAIYNLESVVGPAFIGKIPEVYVLDAILSELDATSERKNLGANVTLAASLAVCKAQAAVEQLEVFETIAQLQGCASVSLPFPLINVVGGGKELKNGFPFQNVMLVPVGAQNFRMALEHALMVSHEYKALLKKQDRIIAINDGGGIFSTYNDPSEPFELLMTALENTGMESVFVLGIDAGADQLFDPHTNTYVWNSQRKTADQLITLYKKLCDSYPLYSLENGLSWQDIQGSKALFESLGGTIQLAVNQGFMHSATLLQGLDTQHVTNASILRLAEVSTLTEFLESVSSCQSQGLNTIIACSNGETDENILADLAVGTSSGQVQGGGIYRGEFLAKYNRLLFIEDLLSAELLSHA
jgi:enolase